MLFFYFSLYPHFYLSTCYHTYFFGLSYPSFSVPFYYRMEEDKENSLSLVTIFLAMFVSVLFLSLLYVYFLIITRVVNILHFIK